MFEFCVFSGGNVAHFLNGLANPLSLLSNSVVFTPQPVTSGRRSPHRFKSLRGKRIVCTHKVVSDYHSTRLGTAELAERDLGLSWNTPLSNNNILAHKEKLFQVTTHQKTNKKSPTLDD